MDALKTIKEGHSNIRKLYTTIVLLSVAVVGLAFFNILLLAEFSNIQPVVIRVSQVGKAEAVKLNAVSSPASEIECRHLSQNIVQYLFGFSRLTWEEDIKRILPYIDETFRPTLLRQYKSVAQQYISAGIDIKIRLFSFAILSDKENVVQVRVDYEKVPSWGGEPPQKYYVILWFKRTKRTVENPYGLSLTGFQENKYLTQ